MNIAARCVSCMVVLNQDIDAFLAVLEAAKKVGEQQARDLAILCPECTKKVNEKGA